MSFSDLIIENHLIAFRIGEFVYLITDSLQLKRMVTEITIRSDGVDYKLSCGNESSYHNSIEISRERDLTMIV